jgi:hypothetical protein
MWVEIIVREAGGPGTASFDPTEFIDEDDEF